MNKKQQTTIQIFDFSTIYTTILLHFAVNIQYKLSISNTNKDPINRFNPGTCLRLFQAEFPTPYVVDLLVGLRLDVVILLVGLRLEVVILFVGLRLEVVILFAG